MSNKIPEDGIYESKGWASINHWPIDRQVYIQNGVVRLVMDDCKYTWAFNFFFEVNILGPRVSNLPENFKIHE